MTCWSCFYNCLPSCLRWKCCAPNTQIIVERVDAPTVKTTASVAAPIITTTTRTTPSSTNHVPAKTHTHITVHSARPPTPDSMTAPQIARVAHIHAYLSHNRLASTEMVSMNRVLNEKRDSTTT